MHVPARRLLQPANVVGVTHDSRVIARPIARGCVAPDRG
jgi:hypothetical protein